MLYTFSKYILYAFCKLFIYFLYTFYIHLIHIWGQDEGQQVATRRVEHGQKTVFPRNVWGPIWGVICYHHWYLRAGLEDQKDHMFQKKF